MLGNFAVGATLTVGILAGVAAIAVAYDKLTSASRKAMAQADKLSESYNRAARISALGIAGQQKADIEDINKGLEQHNKWLGFIIAARIRLGALGGLLSGQQKKQSDAITANTTAAAQAEQERVNAIGLATAAANEKWAARQKEIAEKAAAAAKKAQADFISGITSGIAVFDNLASHGASSSVVNDKLVADYTKLAAQIREMGNASGPAVAELLKLRDALAANLVVAQAIALANSTGTVGPLVGKVLPGVGTTPSAPMPGVPMPKVGSPSDPIVDVVDGVQEQLRKDAEHADMLKTAIWGSAMQLGNTLVSALNIGGGGKGSSLGGSLGATAGFGLGFAFGGGPVGGAIGSTIGNMIGSAVGGLFDKELTQEEIWAKQLREQKAHTEWLRANNGLLGVIAGALLNAPAGYKTAGLRYDATEVKDLRRGLQRYATRGGAPALVTP